MEHQGARTTTRRGRGSLRRRGALLALAAAGLVALIGPSSAHALGFSSFTAQPASTQAGANTNFNISMTFSSASDDVKDLTIGLPPGLIGNPQSAAICTGAQLSSDTCPPDSDVGDVVTNASVLSLPLPIDIPGDLYNITPRAGEPARFGIVLRPVGGILPKVIIESGAELRQSDFGLNTVIEEIPNTSGIPPLEIPIDINSMTVSLAGTAGTPPQGFIRNPTSCVPKAATVTATSYADPDTPVNATAPSFTPTGCNSVPFTPEFSAVIGAPGLTASGTKPPLTTVISQTIEEAGLKRARVILPSNIGSDPNLLTVTCPEVDFQAGTCPPGTIVGSAVAESPLLDDPLLGPVAVVEGSPVPKLGLDLMGPLAMKLTGTFVLGAGTGVEFNGLPDIPISNFALTFAQNGLVVNPTDLCDGAARLFNTEFESHSGVSQTGSKAAALVGCTGGGDKKGKATKCKKGKRKGEGKGKAAASKKKKKKCKRKKRKKK